MHSKIYVSGKYYPLVIQHSLTRIVTNPACVYHKSAFHHLYHKEL